MRKTADSWQKQLDKFLRYIKFERRLSENTVEAYMRDLNDFAAYAKSKQDCQEPQNITHETIEQYLANIYDRGVSKRTQSRILSSLRGFFKFLILTEVITTSPTEFINHPKSSRHLPTVLTFEEISAIIDSFDLSSALGHRNKAMLEMLYSCGLRVSELISLKIQDVFFDDQIVRVIGKGNKQRLVPMSEEAVKQVNLYLMCRPQLAVNHSDILFLNRRGRPLTRIMIFNIIKEAAERVGIKKNISPHTFRHSFATHLLQGGASIRQVQEMLGHESIVTTEIYTHLNTTHLHRTLETLHPMESKNKSRL